MLNTIPKNITWRALILLLVGVISILVVSCEDDWDDKTADTNGEIAFTVTDADDWQSRADEDERNSDDPVWGRYIRTETIGVADSGDTIYAHIYEKEGIDLGVDEDAEDSDSIPVSRATLLGGISSISKFYVKAAYYLDKWTENQTMNLMDDEPFSKDSKGVWRPSTNYLWPGGPYKTRFFAYYPKPDGSNYFTISDGVGTPILHYETFEHESGTANPTYGTDIVVATTGDITGVPQKTPALQFKHILSAVKFVISETAFPGKIYSLGFKDIYTKGDYNMSSGKWTYSGSMHSLGWSPNKTIDPAKDGNTQLISTSLIIPQEGTSTGFSFSYKSDFSSGVSSGFAGYRFTAGVTTTFLISLEESIAPTLSVECSTGSFDFGQEGTGGSATIQIKSSAVIGGKTYAYDYCNWEFLKKLDNGTYTTVSAPEWLNFSTPTKTTTSTDVVLTSQINVAAVTATTTEDIYTSTLKGMDQVGSEGDYESLCKNSSSANCYMVSAPGYYKFPIVYGNSIDKDGNPKVYSYKGSNRSLSFKNYKDDAIGMPWIDDDTGETPGSAKVVWQDAPNLVTDVRYNSTTRYIEFVVDRDNITTGNAVIALCDSNGEIMWSWHIWVNAYEYIPDSPFTAEYNDGASTILNYYLGECPGDEFVDEYAEENSTVLHIWQTHPNKKKIINEKYITISRDVGTRDYNYYGSCPSYQWGRKDPMIPITNSNGVWQNKKIYTDYSGVGVMQNAAVTIANSIKNPHVPYADSGLSWGTDLLYYLWDGGNYGIISKTVYDPCPPGFCVPRSEDLWFGDYIIMPIPVPGGGFTVRLSYGDSDYWVDVPTLTFNYFPSRLSDFSVPPYGDDNLSIDLWTNGQWGWTYEHAYFDMNEINYVIEDKYDGENARTYLIRPIVAPYGD
ncbi:MAG: fimbrillin family protein [Muribaculum sp.]|nr:fimbrillin family protein [Muribaculum sp.]